MEHNQVPTPATTDRRSPWNKGKLVGPKPPLRPSHVWSIRTKLQIDGRKRDLAFFNLAIDSLPHLAVTWSPSASKSTVRYLGIEFDDAIEIAEKIEI